MASPTMDINSLKEFPPLGPDEEINVVLRDIEDYNNDIFIDDNATMNDIQNQLNNIKINNNNNNNNNNNDDTKKSLELVTILEERLINELADIKSIISNHKLEIASTITDMKKFMFDLICSDGPLFKKMKYDNDEKPSEIDFGSYFHDFIRVINGNPDNFGKIVGKSGNNVKTLNEKYNVDVMVPGQKDSKKFPHVIVINYDNNIHNLDRATNHVKGILSSS